MKIKFICSSILVAGLISPQIWADIPVEEQSTNAYGQPVSNSQMDDNSPVVETTPPPAPASTSNDRGFTVQSVNDNPAPVADPVSSAPSPSLQNLPIEQRVARLEQQTTNIASMNLQQQIQQLQQEVAHLRGALDVANHELEALKQVKTTSVAPVAQPATAEAVTPPVSAAKNENTVAPATTQILDTATYQTAFGSMIKHQFDKARTGFTNYLTKFPNGKFAGDAHYWLGEINSINKNSAGALTEFQTVVNKYPTSSKVADSKLKIAMIHASTGKVDLAKTELRAIKIKHPNSTAAQLANIRLQQLEEGG